ncbi:MAG: hypothetical protein P8Y80_04415, partial [Acidobacteriota bacterium]
YEYQHIQTINTPAVEKRVSRITSFTIFLTDILFDALCRKIIGIRVPLRFAARERIFKPFSAAILPH